MDFSKARSIHVLYGHRVLLGEMVKHNKDSAFTRSVCLSARCKTPHRVTVKTS